MVALNTFRWPALLPPGWALQAGKKNFSRFWPIFTHNQFGINKTLSKSRTKKNQNAPNSGGFHCFHAAGLASGSVLGAGDSRNGGNSQNIEAGIYLLQAGEKARLEDADAKARTH